jgi:hypothetical protein
MSKETTRTNNGDGTVTKTTTYTNDSDGSGRSYSHTVKEGIVFDDTVSRSKESWGPTKK